MKVAELNMSEDTITETDVYLTTRQLAAKYRVDGRIMAASWYELLEAWRDQQKLVALRDWKFGESAARTPQRLYLEARVLQLVWTSTRIFAERVKICNTETIRTLLATNKSPDIRFRRPHRRSGSQEDTYSG